MSEGLHFSSLRFARGGRTILEGIGGTLPRGGITAILGPNGAGKSSLLQCLAGLQTISAGAISVGGRPISGLSAAERARVIGFLPQRAEMHWNLSVRALVALGRMVHSGGGRLSHADEAALAAVMADMDIAHLAGREIWSLSGGEQARVLLARVLAGEPEWLLADEPLASLDPAHQIAVLKRLVDTARGGAGVVLVLHDVNHAARIAHHVLLMKDGAIIAAGPCQDVLTPPVLERAYDVPFRRVEDARPLLVPVD